MKNHIIIATAMFLFFSPVAGLCEILAQDIKLSTPRYPIIGKQFNPPHGVFNYDVTWQGIPAASVKVSVNGDAENYRIIAESWTAKAIDLFYKLRYRAEGVITRDTLDPIRTIVDQIENSTHKITQISFLPSDDIVSVRTKVGAGTELIKFNPNNFTLDPFSGAFIGRALDWQLGKTKKFDIFTGKTRHLITLTAERTEIIDTFEGKKEVWAITPTVENLTNPEKSAKFRGATIYLGTDSRRLVYEIDSKVFVGSVRTKMINYTPADKTKDDERIMAMASSGFNKSATLSR